MGFKIQKMTKQDTNQEKAGNPNKWDFFEKAFGNCHFGIFCQIRKLLMFCFN